VIGKLLAILRRIRGAENQVKRRREEYECLFGNPFQDEVILEAVEVL
jgi:hypothetical protein